MRRWMIRGTLVLFSFAVSIAIAELLVRKLAPQDAFIFGMSIYEPDDAADYRLAAHLRMKQGATQGGTTFTTNALGFRNREIAIAKPAGLTRILCLGDSMTFGLQILREDGPYPQQLEKLLNQGEPTPRYEVLNAGVSGYGTDQEVATLRTRLLGLAPDIVTIGFFPSNDVTDNLYQGEKEVYQGLVITARADRTHSFETRVRATLHRWLMPLHLYRYLLLRWKSASEQHTKGAAPAPAAPPAPAEDRGGLSASRRDELSLPAPGSSGWKLGTEDVLSRTLAVFHKTPTPLLEELGWPNTLRYFREARDLAREHGFRLYVVLLPDRLAVDDANREKLLAQLGEDGADLDFELPLRRAKAFLDQERIGTIEVLAALRATGLGAQLFIFDDRHLNARGCQIVASEMARVLRAH
ncbi:MAG: SGNH/GDSL hydrolase family protein [Planctomycetota bacterium]